MDVQTQIVEKNKETQNRTNDCHNVDKRRGKEISKMRHKKGKCRTIITTKKDNKAQPLTTLSMSFE